MEISDITPANERLRQERLRRNWRQRDLAEQLGNTVLSVRRWERGSHQPSIYFREKLCALFGKSAEELGFVLPNASLSVPDKGKERLSRETPSLSHSVPVLWSIPYPRNPFFTGREGILQQLHDTLHHEHTSLLCQSYALSGLGGVGKTQTAIEYAYRYAHDYAAIFWISAEESKSIISSFVTIADLLHLPENQESEQQRIVIAVTCWLNAHSDWLLIFDNVEDIALVQRFLPPVRHGSLLFTSRRQALGIAAQTLNLEKMTEEEGTHFLLHRARLLDRNHLAPAHEAAARAIVATMDGLPLALDQAGAYIEETRCSLLDYQQLFQSTPLRLLAERESYADHPLSVSTTFTLAFARLERSNALAAELLTACAFLAPEAIPEAFFLEGAVHLGPAFEELDADPFQFQAAIKALLTYSLLQRHAATHTLTIHRLVQVVIIDLLAEQTQRAWMKRIIRMLNRAFPMESQLMVCWPWCEQLVPHITRVLTLREYVADPLEVSSLLQKTGTYLSHRAHYLEAESYHQQALDLREQMLGFDHQELVDPLIGLVQATWFLGKMPSVISYAQRVIDILERTQGVKHFALIKPLNFLAQVYRIRGRFTEAERLLLRALSIWVTTMLSDVPSLDQSSFGVLMHEGEVHRAEALTQQVLSLWAQAPQYNHETVGQTLSVLGRVYQQQQRYGEAEAILVSSLLLGKQALGEKHQVMVFPLMSLAEVYKGQGRLREAEQCYHQALTIREQALGHQHPQTMEARTSYIALLRARGGENEEDQVEMV